MLLYNKDIFFIQKQNSENILFSNIFYITYILVLSANLHSGRNSMDIQTNSRVIYNDFIYR